MMQLLGLFHGHKMLPSASKNPITIFTGWLWILWNIPAFAPDKQISAVVLFASLSLGQSFIDLSIASIV